jgi:hypothetical protein
MIDLALASDVVRRVRVSSDRSAGIRPRRSGNPRLEERHREKPVLPLLALLENPTL